MVSQQEIVVEVTSTSSSDSATDQSSGYSAASRRAGRGVSIRRHGGEIRCQQHTRLGQFPDADDRPSETMAAHPVDVRGVHRLEVAASHAQERKERPRGFAEFRVSANTATTPLSADT
jgi:hypothetical protein